MTTAAKGSFVYWVLGLFFWLSFVSTSHAEDLGLLPIPVLNDVEVRSSVSLNFNTGIYAYAYGVINPIANTGKISSVTVNITVPPESQYLSGEGFTVPTITPTRSLVMTFEEEAKYSRGLMVPVGIHPPIGWSGTILGVGRAGWTNLILDGGDILPGQARDNFRMDSRGLPTIREVFIEPDWALLVESEEEVTPEMEARAIQVKQEIIFASSAESVDRIEG